MCDISVCVVHVLRFRSSLGCPPKVCVLRASVNGLKMVLNPIRLSEVGPWEVIRLD